MNKFIGVIEGKVKHKMKYNHVLMEYSKSDEQIILKITYRQRVGINGRYRSDELFNTR